MSSSPRASNPSGAKLLDQSTAHPGSIDKSIFEKKTGTATGSSVGQGTVNPNYLRECREDNPEPASSAAPQDQVALSNCRFLTPVEDLRCNEMFEMAVDAKVTGSANLELVTFRLYSFLTKDGKEERSRVHTWAGSGKPQTPKTDPAVVKATGKLIYEVGTDLSRPIPFEIEAKYCQDKEPTKSPRAEVAYKNVAHWMGGDDLHFRTDGEFPLLGSDGSLIQILSAAVQRIEKQAGQRETVICFGFASSAGDADHNRKLSLRRAQTVKAILDRDENAWNDLAKANFGTADIQQFLSDLHAACGWECDPGAVDGQAGPKTKEAIASFQRECNSRYGTNLKEDGICGPRTWSAVLRVLLGQIQAALGQDASKAPAWKKATWGNAGKGVYGNGEDFATGGDKPEERSVQITFFSAGAEKRLEDPKPGQKVTTKDNPVQDEKVVEKKKIDKNGAGPQKTAPKQTDKDPWVFYAPGRDQYLVISDPTEKDSLLADIKKWQAVQDKVRVFRESMAKTGITNEKIKEGEKLQDEVAKGLKNLGKDPSNAIQEILLWNKNVRTPVAINSRTYIGPDKIGEITKKGNWRKNDDAEVKKILDEWLKQGDSEPKSKVEKSAKIKAVLWESAAVDTQWPWKYKFSKKGEKQTTVGTFSGSAEAQFFRFVAGAEATSEFDLKEKKLQVGAKGGVSYALADGKAEGSWNIPSDKGFDLFQNLALSEKARQAIKPNTECRFRFTVKVEGRVFAGASITGSILLPAIELKDAQKVSVSASGAAFAGASAEGKVSGALDWSQGGVSGKFETLTSVAGTAAGSAGIGAEGKVEFSYSDGKVKFCAGAMVTFGLGGKLGLEYELDAKQAVNLFAHLFESVEWRRVDAVTLAAFEFYLNATFAPIVIGVKALEKPVVATMTDFGNWLGDKAKSAAALANLKTTTYVGSANPALLRAAPPETLGRVIQVLTESFQNEDYDAIINVLSATQSAHELKWTLRYSQRSVNLDSNRSEKAKSDALNLGITRLRSHGKSSSAYASYLARLNAVLRSRGVDS